MVSKLKLSMRKVEKEENAQPLVDFGGSMSGDFPELNPNSDFFPILLYLSFFVRDKTDRMTIFWNTIGVFHLSLKN